MLTLIGCAQLEPEPIVIGLISPLSGALGPSGRAIERGVLLAIAEINQQDGGPLGRPLRLVSYDVANDPEAGIVAFERLRSHDRAVAVFGGIYSPVTLAQLPLAHEHQLPIFTVWGSLSAITENGYQPNYAFRVSANDRDVDQFLTEYALETLAAKRLLIFADTSMWGEANLQNIRQAAEARNLPIGAVVRFRQDSALYTVDLSPITPQPGDVVLMVVNGLDGAAVVRKMATNGWDLPVISHWGISGSDFSQLAGSQLVEGLGTMQTFSFFEPATPVSERVLATYLARFGGASASDIASPIGVAHGYDATLILATALRQAGRTDGPALRAALERLETPIPGLITTYRQPFSPEDHNALGPDDYFIAVWHDGLLIPSDAARQP